LTRLQHLSMDGVIYPWDAASFAGVQQLTALTRLEIGDRADRSTNDVIRLVVERLTGVQHLGLPKASYIDIWQLHALAGLTRLCVGDVMVKASPEMESPLQLPALQCLELGSSYKYKPQYEDAYHLPMWYLSGCPMLQDLSTTRIVLSDPGCVLGLRALSYEPNEDGLLETADVERLVASCSSIRSLQLGMQYDAANLSALAQLPSLTRLSVDGLNHDQFSSVAQLTGLRQLCVGFKQMGEFAWEPTPRDLLQLVALSQLTSLGLTTAGVGQLAEAAQSRMLGRLPGCRHAIVNKVRGQYMVDVLCCRAYIPSVSICF